MEYCVLNSESMITNIVTCSEEYASEHPELVRNFGNLKIGDAYPTLQNLYKENLRLQEVIKATIQTNEMLENCIIEMANTVYA